MTSQTSDSRKYRKGLQNSILSTQQSELDQSASGHLWRNEEASTLSLEERTDEVYEKIGGCGCFQVLAYFAVGWGMSAPSWFIFEPGYLTQKPDYTCEYYSETDQPECNTENICDENPAIKSWDFDYSSSKTLHNWQQKLDLTCTSPFLVSLIGASLFVGWTCALLWVPQIADKKGRKLIFWITMVIQLFLYVGLLITKHLAVMISIWFLFGFLSSIRVQVGYIYLTELMPKKAQTPVTSIWMSQEGFVYVVAVIYFWQISTNWFWFVFIGLCWQIISITLLFFLPESPRFLLNVGKYDEARRAFEQIAKINRMPLEWDEKIFSKANQSSEALLADKAQDTAAENLEEKVSMKYYFKQPKICANLIIMSFVWLTTAFGYYLILSLINTFSDIYVTGLTSSGSEMIAYVVAGLTYERIGPKLSLIISFAISAIGGIMILSWGLKHQDSPVFFVFFLLAKFGISCTFNINFTANSFFFPTLFAATAMGICNFGARLVTSFTYPVSMLDEPWPMILFTGLCCLTCLLSFFLRTEKEDKTQDDKKISKTYE